MAVRSALVVLAAGEGSRAGGPKALIEIGERLVLEEVVIGYASLMLGPFLSVVSPRIAAQIDRRRNFLPGIELILNDQPDATGAADSLSLALQAIEAETVGRPPAVLVTPVDCPPVLPRTIELLAAAVAVPGCIAAVPVYQGEQGHPVLMASSAWKPLAVQAIRLDTWLQGREGVRLVPVDDPGVLLNLNSREEWETWKSQAR